MKVEFHENRVDGQITDSYLYLRSKYDNMRITTDEARELKRILNERPEI